MGFNSGFKGLTYGTSSNNRRGPQLSYGPVREEIWMDKTEHELFSCLPFRLTRSLFIRCHRLYQRALRDKSDRACPRFQHIKKTNKIDYLTVYTKTLHFHDELKKITLIS